MTELDDLRRQRDSLLEVVEGLKRRIYCLRDLLSRLYKSSPAEADALIRRELDNWEEP